MSLQTDGALRPLGMPGPDREELGRWLVRRAIRPDGTVLSWVNAAHPGYPYPEAAGLVLAWLATDGGGADDVVRAVATRLAQDASASGTVGRGGAAYLFDTAVALAGLLAAGAREGRLRDESAVESSFDFVVRAVQERRAVEGAPLVSARWSTTWSPHLLKVVRAARAFRAATGDPRCDAIIGQLANDFTRRAGTLPERGAPAYTHAFLYGLEGLQALSLEGAPVAPSLRRALTWLAGMQDESGGLPSFVPAARGAVPLATDATAQALRLWALDPDGAFAAPMQRALGHLARAQTSSGGVRYQPGSEDENTWCAVFAAQAAAWAEEGPRGELV